jgi:TRAP-type C4-dicarboxylate transport system permease small subunit
MKNLKWFFHNLEEVCGASLLFAMALLAFINVLTRYFIHYSLAFTEELEISGMVYLTMFGASAAFKKDLHLKLMFFELKANHTIRKALKLFSLLIGFTLFALLAFLSYFHIKDIVELEIRTESLDIPEWLYVMAIPLGSLLINFRIIQKIIETVKSKEEI